MTRLAVAAALAAGALGQAVTHFSASGAGRAPAQEGVPSFRTSVDVVRLDALVLDKGRPVRGLTARDFDVLDNGVSQRVDVESLEDAPIDVVLALDTSGSVAGRLLERLTAAADALVGAVEADDRVGLLTFSQMLAIRAPLTPDRGRVRQVLAALDAGGSTSVVDALSAALALPVSSGRPTLVLVFSDGADTASWLTPAQVLDQARRSDVVIDGVVVGGALVPGAARVEATGEDDEHRRFLQLATAATGGRLLDGSRGERLSTAFVEALTSFRQRYALTYTLSGAARSGWHAIEVRVRGRRTATVRARPGYLR